MVGSSNKQPHKDGSRSVHRHSVEDVEVMSQRRRAETAAFIVAADNGGQYWRRELKQVSKFSLAGGSHQPPGAQLQRAVSHCNTKGA